MTLTFEQVLKYWAALYTSIVASRQPGRKKYILNIEIRQ